MAYLYQELTEKIIASAYKVHNELGFGFLEKVYENALRLELSKQGFKVEQQKAINVYYSGETVGYYYADLLVNDKVIIEIKVASAIDKAHEAQLMNYLKASKMKLGLIINFGTSVKIKRMII